MKNSEVIIVIIISISLIFIGGRWYQKSTRPQCSDKQLQETKKEINKKTAQFVCLKNNGKFVESIIEDSFQCDMGEKTYQWNNDRGKFWAENEFN